MAEEDMIIMSQKESNRLYMIRQTINKEITQDHAAEVLGLTTRQVRRLARKVIRERQFRYLSQVPRETVA